MDRTPRADHYFTPQPESDSAEREITFPFGDRRFAFRTDAGVFSHRFVDRGTALLLSKLPLPLEGDVLDWGAGYGVIGIVTAAFSPEARVVLVEINERAAALARRNVEANRVTNAQVVVGDALKALGDQQFDAIVTNPPIHAGKPVVAGLIRDAQARLRLGGELWMVVRTRDGAKSYFATLQGVFSAVERVGMRGGYRVFCATR